MLASCACDVLRAAVVARERVFMRFRRRGGRRALAKMPPLTRSTKISGAKELIDEAENALKNPQKNIGEHG
jgi:hypothetical protein